MTWDKGRSLLLGETAAQKQMREAHQALTSFVDAMSIDPGLVSGKNGVLKEATADLNQLLNLPEEAHDAQWGAKTLEAFNKQQRLLLESPEAQILMAQNRPAEQPMNPLDQFKSFGFLENPFLGKMYGDDGIPRYDSLWGVGGEILKDVGAVASGALPVVSAVCEGVTTAVEWAALNFGASEETAAKYGLFMTIVMPQNITKGLAKAARLALNVEIKAGRITTTAVRGGWGEASAQATKLFSEYTSLPCRLAGNRGIDHVFVKYGAGGKVEDIVVVESKFATAGGAPKLARTEGDKVQQLSNAWMKKQHDALEKVHPDTYNLLLQNRDKIRFKANVLDKDGINRWYDYGRFESGSDLRDAIRTHKGGK